MPGSNLVINEPQGVAEGKMTWIRVRELSWRFAVLGVAVAILTVVVTRWTRWEGRSGWQVTDDAYLQADITPISSKIAGYVSSVSGEDFDPVRPGQLVATLVDDDYRAMVAQAKAALAEARAQAQGLSAQEVLQRSNVQAARAVVAGPPRASNKTLEIWPGNSGY
jgi:membrane fusion protein (multidrug efflux system)